jgi:hypothetical protein
MTPCSSTRRLFDESSGSRDAVRVINCPGDEAWMVARIG